MVPGVLFVGLTQQSSLKDSGSSLHELVYTIMIRLR